LTIGASTIDGYDTLTPISVGTVGNPANYSDLSGVVILSKGTFDYGAKPIKFAEDQIRFTTSNSTWLIYGKRSNGNFLALSLSNGFSLSYFVEFTPAGTYTGLVANAFTCNFAMDITKAFYFDYKATTIDVYQNNVLLLTIPSTYISGKSFSEKAFGFVADANNLTITYSYTKITQPASTSPISVSFIDLEEAAFGQGIVFKDNLIKKIPYPAKNKKIVLYGDSITVAYDSVNYETKLKAKTSALSVVRKGVSGTSFTGDLQNTTNINTVISENPDFVIIHSVNDPRSGAVIGTLADAEGTASMIGGLKKICNALVSANKLVKIILCTPITYGGVAGGWELVRSDYAVGGKYLFEYYQAMINFATAYGITICDLTTNCGFRPQVEGTSNRVFTSDGVHPNAVGYEKMTTLIADVVNKM